MTVKHSLVIPCYNEEGNIDAFFDEACRAMAGYTDAFELVFVNDGSADGTAAALDRLYAAHPERQLTVIHFSRNFGKEAAMYAGLRAARGEYVTVIDADLQQPPATAVKMGRLLDAHPEYDMVAACPEKRREGGFLRFCKKRFYRLIDRVSDVTFIEGASDFRTMRRPVTEALLSMPEYHRFSKGLFAFVGFPTLTVTYTVRERQSGTTKWSFFKLLCARGNYGVYRPAAAAAAVSGRRALVFGCCRSAGGADRAALCRRCGDRMGTGGAFGAAVRDSADYQRRDGRLYRQDSYPEPPSSRLYRAGDQNAGKRRLTAAE